MSGIVSTILICILYLFFTLMGMSLIKAGYDSPALFQIPLINVGVSVRLLIGIIFYGLSFLTFVLFVSRLKISVAIPVVSGIYCVFTVIVGYYFFHERITAGQIVGIAMVIIGTVLVGIFKG